jgi:UDP-N-acetylmuramoyl-L-alanyl-D-glutamate--2,6-diaminopimelate ligase
VVIVTSDNPRTEDPPAIIAEIESGITGATGAGRHLVLPDRAAAIERAVAMARPGDVVVLAGKGHEDYQIIGETRHRFDDREAARTAIRKARAA